MPDLSRHGRYLVWLAGVMVGTVLLALALVPADEWVALDQRRSSTRTTEDGVAAWAGSLERLGVSVAPRFTSLTDAPPSGGGLVVLEPVLGPTADEVHEILAWVREGGVLVYAPRWGGLVMDSLGLSLDGGSDWDAEEAEEPVPQLVPHRWTAGMEGKEVVSWWSLEADSTRNETWVPLAQTKDSAAVTVAWLPEGHGGALVVADAQELSNGALGESTLAVLLTRAVADLLAPGDTLFFSEFHQALDGRRGVFREAYALAASSPLGRVLLHLAVTGLILYVLAGRRFGAPLPDLETDRRSPLEHVEALARIYGTSASRQPVARRLIRGAARRMGRRPRGAEGEVELLRAWAERPDLARPARAALDALEATPPDLEALSAALDRIAADPTSSADHE